MECGKELEWTVFFSEEIFEGGNVEGRAQMWTEGPYLRWKLEV